MNIEKRSVEFDVKNDSDVHANTTTFELREVVAAWRRLARSSRLTGVDISVRYSTDFAAAFENDSAMIVGWIPFSSNFSAAPNRLPAITTTDVVPSPASMSCATDRSTSYRTNVSPKPTICSTDDGTNHFCCGMQSLNAFQNCRAIVCYNNLSF